MRGYVLSIWDFFDPLYFSCTRLTIPPRAGMENNIFRIRLTKYKGKEVILSDGTKINKNDLLIKIHLHNVKLLKELKDIKSELKKAKIIYRHVQQSLPGVEHFLRNNRRSGEIKGIVGITHLNKGCERLGFEIFDISHPLYKWFKWFAFLPIDILSSRNNSIRHMFKLHFPKYLFMSSDQLTKLYRI
ncbi:YkoP family protein [Schinkia sp. CFF1]